MNKDIKFELKVSKNKLRDEIQSWSDREIIEFFKELEQSRDTERFARKIIAWAEDIRKDWGFVRHIGF